ncbi:hypothetical protein [Actinoplanes sp. CA-252034]|uniref:hypothetical protein n=1 Tax=Actinoplanes sp. CA-252034 TaxID=3239906 RepID=UPI003D9867EC
MADTTTRYGFPFQEATDPPNGADLGQALAEAIEARVATIDDRVTAINARISALETEVGRRGLRVYGNRGTGKTITSAETPILRVDGLALKGGRAYSIRAPQIRIDFATSTDKAAFQLRVSTSGVATTTSASVAHCETGDQQTGSMEHVRMPTADETVSVLISGRQYAGSSAGSVLADSNNMALIVEDLGPLVPDTGVDL